MSLPALSLTSRMTRIVLGGAASPSAIVTSSSMAQPPLAPATRSCRVSCSAENTIPYRNKGRTMRGGESHLRLRFKDRHVIAPALRLTTFPCVMFLQKRSTWHKISQSDRSIAESTCLSREKNAVAVRHSPAALPPAAHRSAAHFGGGAPHWVHLSSVGRSDKLRMSTISGLSQSQTNLKIGAGPRCVAQS